jgi:DUF4097 and DUF4098 domain-containing protein YvlB
MNDERLQILNMVAERTITPEEGERLLKALNEGAQKRQEAAEDRQSGVKGVVLSKVASALADIGPTVQAAVEEVQEGLLDDDPHMDDPEDDPSADRLPTDSFELAPGSTLVIKSSGRRCCTAANLVLTGTAGSECKISGQGAAGARVSRRGDRTVVRWPEGTLEISVPSTVAELTAATRGGNVSVDGVAAPLHIKTMGGNLRLAGVGHPFEAKTVGGDVRLALASAWHGRGKATTMGGSIQVDVPHDLAPTDIDAATLGGSVTQDVGTERGRSGIGRHKVSIRIGEGTPESRLSLKTMGGDIRLRKDTTGG